MKSIKLTILSFFISILTFAQTEVDCISGYDDLIKKEMFKECIECLTKEINRKLTLTDIDYDYISLLYKKISETYFESKDLNNALLNYKKSLNYLTKYHEIQKKDPETYRDWDDNIVYFNYDSVWAFQFDDIYDKIGDVFLGLSKNDSALYYYKKISRGSGRWENLFSLKKYDIIEEECSEIVKEEGSKLMTINNENSEAYYWRGKVYSKQNEIDLAISDFEKYQEFLNLKHTHYFIKYNGYYALANLFYENLKFEKALSYIELAIKIDNEKSELYILKGKICIENNQDDLAVQSFQLAQKIENESLKSEISQAGYFWLSDFYTKKREYEKALSYIDSAITIKPRDFVNYLNKGFIYEKYEKKYDLAFQYFNKAFEYAITNEDKAFVYYCYSVIYKDQNQYIKSMEFINKAIELALENSSYYFFKSELYDIQNNYNLAIQFIDKAIKVDVSLFNVSYCNAVKGRYLIMLDKYEEAKTCVEIAKKDVENTFQLMHGFESPFASEFERVYSDLNKDRQTTIDGFIKDGEDIVEQLNIYKNALEFQYTYKILSPDYKPEDVKLKLIDLQKRYDEMIKIIENK